MSQELRLMAVHAHPDDESSKGAATMAKYVADGVQVMVVSCTGGERGDILNEKLKGDPHIARDLAQVRREEMARAVEILGVQHTWLGFVDSGLPEGDPLPPLPPGCFALEPVSVAAEALVRVIRDFKPHVITTYDENGGYPHPDHIMTHTVSMAAFHAAGDPTAYPHAGEPWQPLKVYYSGWSMKRIRAIHQAMEDEGLESPYQEWIAGMRKRPEREMFTAVPCAEYFTTRDEALKAHATQVDPDGFWFQVPLELQQRVHPTEDWELALSLVEPQFPEDDLFAGLRELDLETVCRQEPERDTAGQVVAVHRSTPPPPVDEDQDGVDDSRQTDDLEDEITEMEGHHDSDGERAS
ncbi:MAG TPA: mycothiol conjugate amidase Mca [Ornithinicoccus sp.]|nr:mycothiol conjugate amidase Mca [Ornithinicoccus sp.]